MKLKEIQASLKAPKGQFNGFGKYKYRSCEDIVEAVKPLLDKHGLALVISDEIQLIGDRYYVKATAQIIGEETYTATAYAREPAEKKGMDASQITGMASSYARKYALNGLFAIDDTKDADTMDNSEVKHIAKPMSLAEAKRILGDTANLVFTHYQNDDTFGMKEVLSEMTDNEKIALKRIYTHQDNNIFDDIMAIYNRKVA